MSVLIITAVEHQYNDFTPRVFNNKRDLIDGMSKLGWELRHNLSISDHYKTRVAFLNKGDVEFDFIVQWGKIGQN